MVKDNIEKILLGIGGLLFLLLTAFGLIGGTSPASVVDRGDPTINRYQSEPLPIPQVEAIVWETFGPQRDEEGWVFSLFTPPSVWFDPDEEQFFPRPPSLPEREPVKVDEPEGPIEVEVGFGVIFNGFEEVPFPIVLDGYVGEEGDYFLNLRNLDTGETFLSRPGREHPGAHQIRIDDFQRLRLEEDGLRFSVGEMRVTNLRNNEQYVLREGERIGSGEYKARFTSTEEQDREFHLDQGDEEEIGGVVFTLEKMDLESDEVVVRREETDTGLIDRVTLQPGQIVLLTRFVEVNSED